MAYETSNIDNITPSYLASYGLTEPPFSSQQNDRFFYLNTELHERLELLKHYTQYGNLLLLITGERGIGKSSLKRQFISSAQEEWQICEIEAHTMMDASLLLRQIATGFNITEPPLEPAVLFEVLSEQLEHMHQQAIVPILIIDDAHELPQDALQALLYLAEHHSDQHTALRIILFCEPEIETMLDDPSIYSLKERVTHSMELTPLSEEQTSDYLRHRLGVAGLDGTSPFTPKLVHKIYLAAEGIPAKINEYAHQNLLDDTEPFVEDELNLDEDIEQNADNLTHFNIRNIAFAGLAISVIISVLVFQERINELFEEPKLNDTFVENNEVQILNENKSAAATTEIVQSEKILAEEKAIKVESREDKLAVKEKVIEFNLNEPLISKNESKEKIEEAVTPVKLVPAIKALQLTSVNPSPIAASKQRQIISISGTGFHKRQKVKVSWTGKEKILSDTQVNITSDHYMNLILNTGTNSDTWTVTVVDTLLNLESNTISFDVLAADKEKPSKKSKLAQQEKVPAKITTQLSTQQENGLLGEDWIRQQNKNHFTLQLLATYNKNTLPKYLKDFSLTNAAATFKSKRNNKDWFTLIYGHYPTKAAAQNAAKQLPKGVATPWLRSFSSIFPSLSSDAPNNSVASNDETNKNIVNNDVKKTSAIISPDTVPNNQEGWLWSQDPSHYTLQLAAGTDKKAIQSFVKRHSLRGKTAYFHRLRDGKDWYILVHGSYTGYSKAKKAISQLPSAVQNVKPWTRTFGAIHAELN